MKKNKKKENKPLDDAKSKINLAQVENNNEIINKRTNTMNYKCVLFCEDIRQEVGGKMSLMGVLGNKLLVPQFPLHMPKFCLFIEWTEQIGKAMINLKIMTPNEEQAPKTLPIEVVGQPGIVSRSLVVMNGYVFEHPGVYTFEFECEGQIIGRENFSIEEFKPQNATIN